MTNRELVKATLRFEKTDRICHAEHGFWDETYQRWREEGLPENIEKTQWLSPTQNEDLFRKFDICKFEYVRPNNYIYPSFAPKLIEDTAEYCIYKSDLGVTIKRSKTSISIPGYLDYDIKDRNSYYARKDELTGNIRERYPDNWDDFAVFVKKQQFNPVCTHMDGFFAYPRELMGVENMLYMFYDDPPLMKEIINDRVDFYIKLYEKAIIDTKPDFAFIWEDMSFKNGPLVSPGIFREFMMPAYKKLILYLNDMGVHDIIVDSDGDVSKLIPLWLESGVTGVLPFEVNAGMDVVKIGEEFPELCIFGGIDKLKIAKGRNFIDAELARVLPAMRRRGGYFVTLDHWVPPDISLADFTYYTEKIKDYN